LRLGGFDAARGDFAIDGNRVGANKVQANALAEFSFGPSAIVRLWLVLSGL
jgi:hypothetical protein